MASIDALLKEGRTEEAVALIKNELEHATEEQRGAMLAEYTLLYMKAANEENKRYSKVLSEIIAALKGIEQAEKKLDKIAKK